MGHAALKVPLIDRVRRLFAERRAEAGRRAADQRPGPAPRRQLPRETADAISGARFSLVGLSDLREQLGDRWPELSARVHDLAQAVIQRHLGRGDVYDAQGDDSYVILFTQLTELQAEFKCRVIAKEIAGKLLGADWVGRGADGVVFELPEAALRAPSFEAALGAAIARGRPVTSADGELPVVRVHAAAPAADGEPGPERAASLAQALKPIDRERRTAAYWPVWDLGAEALLRFRFKTPGLAAGATVSDAAKADVAALTQTMFDVGRLLETGRRLPVICPIRFETVVRDAWRAQIARMLRGAPPPLRKLVTLEVVVAPSEADWLAAVERAWSALPDAPIVAVPLMATAIPARASDVVRRLNLALTEGFSANKRGIAALGGFAQRAERVGMTCAVSGLRTRAAALAATAAGFSQLSGPAIHAEVASLGQAVHFDLRTLYRDLLPQAR